MQFSVKEPIFCAHEIRSIIIQTNKSLYISRYGSIAGVNYKKDIIN